MLKNKFHPGQFLREELEERGISQSSLARHIKVGANVINQICNEKRGISPEMAKKLAVAFGTSPQLWMNLQGTFDLYHAKEPDFGRLRA
jgi:addiction module HigA family antidote